MFSRNLTGPWRRAFSGQTAPGGRVDLEEKPRIDNNTILLEIGHLLKPVEVPCG
jgi:hypothetical protein